MASCSGCGAPDDQGCRRDCPESNRFINPDDVVKERDMLRAALAGLVGCDTLSELEELEYTIRSMPVPDEDRAVTINAIHALVATHRG